MMFKSMSLGMKLGLGFGTLIALTAALGGLAVWNGNRMSQDLRVMDGEFMEELALASGIERSARESMYNIRAYVYSGDESFLTEGRKFIAEGKSELTKAATLAEQSSHLTGLKEGVDTLGAKLGEYDQLLSDTVAKDAAIAKQRATLVDIAVKYAKDCTDVLAGQTEALRQDVANGAAADKLSERTAQLTLGNSTIDLVNAARIKFWKATALRNTKMLEEAAKDLETADQKLNELKAITREDEQLKRIEEMRTAGNSYRATLAALITDWTAREDIGKKRGAAATAVLDRSKAIAQSATEGMDQVVSNSVKSTATASMITVVGVVMAALVGVLLAVLITRGVTKPLRDLFRGLTRFSTAELRDTGDQFNRIIDSMAEGVAQVSDASAQVSAASQELAAGASEQASSLEETSSALEQMSAMARSNATSSKEANELATQAHKDANAGEQTMIGINEASDKISRIIKVIEEIAFQTNLLALNAAVEAARAGEHGKGFAVVAEEVRNLAQRAAAAAKETTGLIEDSVNKSREGKASVQAIVTGVAKVTELINGIARASDEQAQGVEQVNAAVSQMDKVTQQNAAGAEESASASEELTAQAASTKALVDELMGLVRGSVGQTAARSVAHTKPASHRAPLQKATASAGKQFQKQNLASPGWSVPDETTSAATPSVDEQVKDF